MAIDRNRVPQALFNSCALFNPFQYKPFLKLFTWESNGVSGKWVWNGNNLCIFDEVGVGKTIEAGIILRQFMPYGEFSNRRVLILCPVKLAGNWADELGRMFEIHPVNYRESKCFGRISLLPFSYFTYAGGSKKPEEANGNSADATKSELFYESKSEETDSPDIDDSRLAAAVEAVPAFDILIVDEAHYLRNEGGARYKAVAELMKKHTKRGPVIFMTGTPIVNRATDMDNLFTLIQSGGKKAQSTQSLQCVANCYDFMPEIIQLDVEPYVSYQNINNFINNNSFGKRSMSIKCMAASSLYCLYQSLCKKSVELAISDEDDAFEDIESEDGDEDSTASADDIIQLINSILANDSPKKSDFMAIDTKFKIFAEMLESEFKQANNKKQAIVFCHFKATMDYLEACLEDRGITTFRIDGDTVFKSISDIKKSFRVCENPAVLLCSDAAKEGHNLQFCHLMFHYDYAFTASDLAQRIGRIYRKGQTENPKVYYVHVNNSYDDRMLDIVLGKARLTESGGIVPLTSFVPQNKKPSELLRAWFNYNYNIISPKTDMDESKLTEKFGESIIALVKGHPYLCKFPDLCKVFNLLEYKRGQLNAGIADSGQKITKETFYTGNILNLLFGDDASDNAVIRKDIYRRNAKEYLAEERSVALRLFGESADMKKLLNEALNAAGNGTKLRTRFCDEMYYSPDAENPDNNNKMYHSPDAENPDNNNSMDISDYLGQFKPLFRLYKR